MRKCFIKGIGFASLLLGLLLAQGLTADVMADEAAPVRPNIVVLLADDLGYGDLGAYGNDRARTPRLDQLAAQGVRMSDFYAAHPTCAPSRAGLLTGRYQHRFGFEHNPGRDHLDNPGYGIPADEPTLAERLRALGYATGVVGKWHIGYVPPMTPLEKGFDSFFGTLHGAMAYVPDGPTGLKSLTRNHADSPMVAHTTEAFADEAIAFIRKHRERPFFLYVPFTAVHAPLQSTSAYLGRFADEPDTRRRAYLAMLAALDDAVGRIVDEIDENGLSDRTLIVFTSDNGGPTWQTTSSNAPLNGVKATLLEGGIRVPTLIRWSGKVPGGTVNSFPGIGQDIAATALAVAGAPADVALDGVNLMPHLSGSEGAPARNTLYWRSGTQGAMRVDSWKVLKANDAWLLFDLATDIGERNDLAEAQPERLAEMRARWEAWSDTLRSPAWERLNVNPGVDRDAGVERLIYDFVAGRPVDPRPWLYGGGPE